MLDKAQNTGMGNHQLVFIGWWQGIHGYCAWERTEVLGISGICPIFTAGLCVEKVVGISNRLPYYSRK